jgi:hypothetical protein
VTGTVYRRNKPLTRLNLTSFDFATLSHKGRGKEGISYRHFGESIGTLAHTQFFQEPSSATQADDVEGTCSGAAA